MTSCVVVADTSPDPEREEIRSADLVVPLFVEGAFALQRWQERIRSPTELIPRSRFRDLAAQAVRCRDRFLEMACQGELLDGIDIPAMFRADEHLMLFREILFGQELGRALLERGIEKATWIAGTSGDRVAEELYRAWIATITPGVRVIRPWETGLAGRGRALREKLTYPLRKVRNRLLSHKTKIGKCRCVGVFVSRQWQRFQDTICDLGAHFGENFQLWYLGVADRPLEDWSEAHGIELVSLVYPQRVDRDIEELFDSHQARWSAHGREFFAEEMLCPVILEPKVAELFDGIFGLTFRRTAQWARELRKALVLAEPELVVASAAFAVTSAMPLHVAAGLEIPSLALSHTQVSGDHSRVVGTYLACRNHFEREGFRRSFPDDARVLYCRNSSDEVSYKVTKDRHPDLPKGLVIALLTAAPGFHRQAMPFYESGEYLRSLRELSQPPEDLRELTFVWKFHPRFDLSHLLEELDLPPNVGVFPSTASIKDLISDSWLCALVNHFGGVAADVAAEGRPLIFLDSAGYCFPFVQPSGLTSMKILETVDSFWDLLRELLEHRDLHAELAHQSREFRDRYLVAPEQTLAQELSGKGF